MEADIELVEGEVQLDILRQQPHDLGLQPTPGRPKARQTLLGLCPRRRLKNRMCIGRELLTPQPSRLLKAQGFLAGRVGHYEITIAEVPLQTTDFMHCT